ncbi:DUF4402 domain-containing protein [Massilia sp. TS11]|uniref:DUF4402 domain-containing protein n=1 Tax=Massilia sp. TS11 TaxID=2908003 RepID=UPI001EDAEFFA|nr:DUF4402 domain-containing protein [Massilia sp. TS11]MCG2586473.1 DUF4402 domain-containing protein [Massilia sp. TS11]
MRIFRFLCGLLLAGVCGAAAAVPFRINTSQGLAFGSFVAASGGSVTVSPAGLRTASGAVTLISSDGGRPAAFIVSGNNNWTYTITLPSQATLVNANGQTMVLNHFTSTPSDSTASSGLLSGGSQMLYVGATLQVNANQASGSYSGSFTVIVDNP